MSRRGPLGEGNLGQGWAPKNNGLTPRQRAENENAVQTLLSTMGGLEGMLVNGVSFKDLSWILEADPADDLSGLRDLSKRFVSSRAQTSRMAIEGDVLLPPHVARHWLMKSGRAVTNDEGILNLVTEEVDPDHLSQAGFLIAQGEHPRSFADVYTEVTTSEAPLNPDAINSLARTIIQDYLNTPPSR